MYSRFSVVMIYETGKCGLQALLVTFTCLKVPLAQRLYSFSPSHEQDSSAKGGN